MSPVSGWSCSLGSLVRAGSSDDLIHPGEDEANRLTGFPSKLTQLHFKVLSDSWGPGLGSGSASGAAQWRAQNPCMERARAHSARSEAAFAEQARSFLGLCFDFS